MKDDKPKNWSLHVKKGNSQQSDLTSFPGQFVAFNGAFFLAPFVG